jgi:uncharacterized protein (TIGR00369 family)
MRDQPAPLPGKTSGLRLLIGYHAAVWREGFAEIELRLEPQHLNSIGFMHGGLHATLLDAAFGHAATWCSVKGNRRSCVTVSLTTTYLEPGRLGEVVRAIGRLEGIESRIALCRGEIVAGDGRLIAIGQGSFRYLPGSERVEGVAREAAT